MVEDYRVKKYISGKYYNEIFKELQKQIDSEFNRTRFCIKLNDFDINTIWFAHKGIDTFYCDLYVDANISDYDDYKEDGKVKRYFIRCDGNIDMNGIHLRNFEVQDGPSEYKLLLSNSFMPLMKNEKFDIVANDILQEYCPSYVGSGIVNVNEILNKLGLDIKFLHLRNVGNVYGLIAFEDMKLDTYTNNASDIPANTIVLNSGHYALFGEFTNRDRFTIVHECVHKILHYKHFIYNKLFNESSASAIKCETTGEYSEEENIKHMERQANNIASRILVPQRKLLNSIEIFKGISNLSTVNDYVEMLECLKEEYKVSYPVLKIRLVELGYTKFVGINEYLDGMMVKPYISTTNLESNESYTIKKEDVFRLEVTDKRLKSLLREYNFIYVDNHLCLNSPKYVCSRDNKICMTEYALNHIDECCLKFEYSFKVRNIDVNNSYLVLCRLDGYVVPNPHFKNHSIQEDALKYNAALWKEKNNALLEFRKKSLNNDLANNLRKVIEASELTQELVAEYTTVSLSTIEKILSGKNSKPKISTLMLICVGLHLPPVISNDLFNSAGHNLDDTNLKTQWVRDAVFLMYTQDARDVKKMYEETFKEESE